MSLVTLVAVGDVNISYLMNPFEKTSHILKAADITFGNMEGPYFDGRARGDIVTWTPTWSPAASRPGGPRSGVKGLEYMVDAGFDVVQLANNHSLDWGEAAFLASLSNLEATSIKGCGAGRNLAEARKPAIIERKGLKCAFLSYTSIYKWSNEARENRPGMVTIRIEPFYEEPHVNKDELGAMKDDIKDAKKKVDLVIVADHWGMSHGYMLDMPQKAIGHAAIDAGADLMLGTHPHVLQGIEIYNGKIIVYSLANFVFATGRTFDSLLLNFTLSKKGVESAYFNPIISNDQERPEIPSPGSERFDKIVKLMTRFCGELGTTLQVEKDKIWIKK